MSIVPEGFNRIIPRAPTIVDERIARHQLRRELTYELQQRQAFKDYCAWYRTVAKQHQEELARWRGCSVADLRQVTARSSSLGARQTVDSRSRSRSIWTWLRGLWTS